MSMATPSSLISKIHPVLHFLASNPLFWQTSVYELMIGLRNLKVLLVCLRNLGDADTHAIQSLFLRIEVAIGRIPTQGYALGYSYVGVVNCLGKEVKDEWCSTALSNHLTLDDVIEIADTVVHNPADILAVRLVAVQNPATLRGIMDEFEVHTRFLRDFLLFAKRSGVESQQLQDLLIHIRPFVMDAARAFQMDGPFFVRDENGVEEILSKCPRVDPQVFQSCTQTLLSMSMLDQTNGGDVLMDFLGSLVSLLWHLLRYQCYPGHSASLKALYECLRLSRFILKRQQDKNGFLGRQVGVLIRDAGVVTCSLYLADFDSPHLSDLLLRFEVVRAHASLESNSLKPNDLDFGDGSKMEDISDGKIQIDNAMARHQSSSTPTEVGFQEDEVASIMDRLTRGSKQLRLLPISGMAGVGKTTFAFKVYNHQSIIYRFQARAWCPISQVFDKKRVLLQLLKQIQPGDYLKMNEDDLANKLRQSLKQKRYLIFLDDVWSPQVLESLRPSFPDDRTESRIVLTSRLHAIISHALPDEKPHFLRLRKENECLEIIEMKLLHKVGQTTELKQFAKLCKGLPLTAVIVAGLLATVVQEGWEGILDHLSSGGISNAEQCKNALEFSYKHLPNELKLCFIYFGVFPEDEEIYTKKLIQLWIAEGFVEKKNHLLKMRIEDVAEEYLVSLIQRNLVMVVETRSMGGAKTCRIHDLLQDFCLMKGKQQGTYHRLLQRYDELSDFNEPVNLERISIHSDALHFKESELFCPRAHSMLFFTTMGHLSNPRMFDIQFIIQTFKLLKVLNMDQIRLSRIPSEITLLTRLTYISIECGIPLIPSSIGKLSNLESLLINHYATHEVLLPHTIWDLQKLKYLHFTRGSDSPSFSFSNVDLVNSPNLLALEAICGISFYSNEIMEKQTRKFPNIRKLKCNIQRRGRSPEALNKMIVVPESLCQLESVTIFTENQLQYQFDFGSSAENLRKVTLRNFLLSRQEIAVIGKLPNLEVLKFIRIYFLGGTMEIEKGEFSKLRILSLRETINLETWTTTEDDQLPCLEKLLFYDCRNLKEIPDSCLEYSTTLEEIEVSRSSLTLESTVKRIEKAKKDFGNLIKVKFDSGG